LANFIHQIFRMVWAGVSVLVLSTITYADEAIPAGKSDSVVFNTLYESILKDAGVDYVMLDLPTARKRRMFVEAELLIDCCAASAWRTRPSELAVQLHSKPFVQSAEHYFYHIDNAIDVSSTDELQKYRLAVVRGFVYKDDHLFRYVVGAATTAEMMKLVAIGRAEVGIINPYDFKRRLEKSKLPLRLGGVHEASPLVIRVHKKVGHYLPKINAVIDRYREEGRLDKTQLLGPSSH